MAVAMRPPKLETPPTPRRRMKCVGWQGFTLEVPENWDVTGFSGSEAEGYLRIDDGEEQGLELKWATEPARSKKAPDVEVRTEAYLLTLERAAKKKRLSFDSKITEPTRGVQRPERSAQSFQWTGDRKAIGALWYCAETRRVVIAQVLGDRSGKHGLSGIAESVLATIENKDAEPGWRLWSLYGLHVALPSAYQLTSQQLMNVYLRLSFAHQTARLTVEHWSVANVARRDAYLDTWLESNARGELAQARVGVEPTEWQGHEAVRMRGGLAFGQPWVQALREVLSLRWPATRFSGVAWHCEDSNAIVAIESLRPGRVTDPVDGIAARLRCHEVSE